MKYFILAGEPSGDLHGANLVKALKETDPSAQFRGTGGSLMKSAGVDIVLDYREMAFMGFAEVISNLRKIKRNFRLCESQIEATNPDALILIDYPGFNMRIAKWAKARQIKVIYYISPQVWAWKQGRVKVLKATVDRMLTILPFEKEFYSKFGMDVDFVGHPLLDELKEKQFSSREEFSKQNNLPDKPLVALLPGSRTQEISRMLPLMGAVAHSFPEYQFVIAGAPGQDAKVYEKIFPGIPVVHGQTYNLLHHSSAALVTSGTATLETALLKVPEVVCYKANRLSYQIAKRLIKVPYISLVNLIMNREVVKELIQNELNISNLKAELDLLLHNQVKKEKISADYDELIQLLGGHGASHRAAEIIYGEAKK